MIVHYADGLNVDWSEEELRKIQEIKNNPTRTKKWRSGFRGTSKKQQENKEKRLNELQQIVQ